MSAFDAVDLFAGPGGWDVAARELGVSVVGVEFDKWACETRRAAGLATVEADVRTLNPLDYDAPGFIASPPCQTFSAAGGGAGRRALDTVIGGVRLLLAGEPLPEYEDERTALVLEPLRWILARHRAGKPYKWIALEQVPPVLPVWEEYAHVLRELGYGVATGNLHAEEYGVPQTRKRAILVARFGCGVALPTPTHMRYRTGVPQADVALGLEPWVSMADALGGGMTSRPRPTIAFSRTSGGPDKEKVGGSAARAIIYAERDAGRWAPEFNDQSGTDFDPEWPWKRPASTVAGRDLVGNPGATANRFNGSTKSRNDGVRIGELDAATLQSFPSDHPFQGNKTQVFQQIGNAIPPKLASAVLSAVTR